MNAPVQIETPDLKASKPQESFHEYLRIVGRHRLSIIAITLLFSLFGVLYSAIQTPVYVASAMLQIEREAPRYIEVSNLYGGGGQSFEYYQTQYVILRTRPLAARVVDAVGARKIVDAMNSVERFSLRKYLPFLPAPDVPKPLTDEQARDTAIGIVQGGVDIEPVRNSQLVWVNIALTNKEMAAVLANALAQTYVENVLEARVGQVSDAAQWLSGKLGELKTNVSGAEDNLQKFMEKEGLVDLRGIDSLANQQVTSLSADLATARGERMARENVYQQVQAARSSGRLADVPSLLVNPLVAQGRAKMLDKEKDVDELRAKYGPKMPLLVEAESQLLVARRAFEQQLEQAANAIELEYQGTVAVERQFSSQLSGATQEARNIGGKSVEFNRLSREAEASRQVYEKFKTQFNQTEASKEMPTSNARVVEAALLPTFRTSPNTRRTVIAATLIGFALAILLAFLLEHLDSTIKTAEDVERLLEVPVLGLMPNIKGTTRGDGQLLKYFSEHSKSQFAESVRTVRTNVLLSGIDRQRKRILVTSSVPGEGKTTMSLNLAQSLGQMNKVLLIDADMRRPTVARIFGNAQPTVGLSQFISGEAKISDCVHQLENSNTFIMTAGVIPPNPLELLSSQKFSEALSNLNKVFEYIIIDCAPALAVSDALVLSRLVDGVIYVIKCDATPHQAAASGIKRLRRVDAPLLGVVLNRVGERSHGYGYGRYAYYADGYYAHYGYYQQNEKSSRKKG